MQKIRGMAFAGQELEAMCRSGDDGLSKYVTFGAKKCVAANYPLQVSLRCRLSADPTRPLGPIVQTTADQAVVLAL